MKHETQNKFTQEEENKFIKDMQEFQFESDSEMEESFYETQKKQMNDHIQLHKAPKPNQILHQLKQNHQQEQLILTSFQAEIQELKKITNNQEMNVIKPEQLQLIKQRVAENNQAVLTLADDNYNLSVVQALNQSQPNIKNTSQIKQEQHAILQKIEQATLERERLNMQAEDKLSLKNQLQFLSQFFAERFFIVNLPKLTQKDQSFLTHSVKPKATFTNLIPLPNTQENVLPKNSPEIALKNLKASKRISLKPISQSVVKVCSKKIEENNSQKQFIENNVMEFEEEKQNVNKLVVSYSQKISKHTLEIGEISKKYKPKYLEHYLDAKEKNLNSELDEEPEGKSKKEKSLEFLGAEENKAVLREFKLTFESITSLKGIHHLKLIEYAALQFNQIADLAQIHLCKHLIELNLSQNKIKNIQPLSSLAWLRYLNLEKNLLKSIDFGGKALEIGYFGFNFIEQIQDFNSNTNMRILHLNNNKVRQIAGISKLYFLEELNLSRNFLKSLRNQKGESNALENLFLLKRLNLADNRLEELPMPFCSLILNELNLSSNSLKRIDSLLLPCLERLYLIKNKLRQIAVSSTIYLPNLKELNLDENEIEGFSFIWQMLRYSQSLEILKYNNNEYFLSLREKVREVYEYMVYANMKHLKILNQCDLSIGMKKYYEANYHVYLNQTQPFFISKHQMLVNLELWILSILNQAKAESIIQLSKHKFVMQTIFIQLKSIKKAENLIKIVTFVAQNQSQTQSSQPFLLSNSLFYHFDHFEQQIRNSLHKIRGLVVAKKYRLKKRKSYFKKNRDKIIDCIAKINSLQKNLDLKKVIRKFKQLLWNVKKVDLVIKIQKVCRAFIPRRRFARVLNKLKMDEDESEIQEFDTDFFDQELENYDFDFKVNGVNMEEYIIRPEVFQYLKKQEQNKSKNSKKDERVTKQNGQSKDPLIDNYVQENKKQERQAPKRNAEGYTEEELAKLKAWGYTDTKMIDIWRLKDQKKEKERRKEAEKNMTASERYEKFKKS